MPSTTKPNFFIVGAPKSGTTSLATYLGEHPEVFMLKGWDEPHFFGSDLPAGHRFEGSEREYLAMFEGARGRSRIGEKSTWYLYSRLAAGEIRSFAADARIIIMLRDPVEMMHSLYAHNVYRGYEDLPDFEAALDAQARREQGLEVPATVRLPDHLLYTRVPRYADQVERYLTVFGSEAVHIVVFEDFRADVRGEFRKVAEFLEIDTSFEPTFRVWNPRKRIRSRKLQLLYDKLSTKRDGHVARLLLPPVARMLGRANVAEVSGQPLRPELRRRLLAELRGDIDRLARLTGRDLSHWTRL